MSNAGRNISKRNNEKVSFMFLGRKPRFHAIFSILIFFSFQKILALADFIFYQTALSLEKRVRIPQKLDFFGFRCCGNMLCCRNLIVLVSWFGISMSWNFGLQISMAGCFGLEISMTFFNAQKNFCVNLERRNYIKVMIA